MQLLADVKKIGGFSRHPSSTALVVADGGLEGDLSCFLMFFQSNLFSLTCLAKRNPPQAANLLLSSCDERINYMYNDGTRVPLWAYRAAAAWK